MKNWQREAEKDVKKLIPIDDAEKMMEIVQDPDKMNDLVNTFIGIAEKHLPKDHWERKMLPLKKKMLDTAYKEYKDGEKEYLEK